MPEGKQKKNNPKHDLEDYEPGAERDEVLQALSKVAGKDVESKRKANQRSEPPAPSSS